MNLEPPKPYRWVMLALLWLLYITFGLVSRSIFPLVTPILADLELSYSQMGLILGSWQLTYIFAALVAGTILDRWGVRKSIFAGVMVIGLSASLRYFSDGFISMLTAVALFGLGGPMISIGGPKTISAWFHGRSRGTAMGIYTTGNWAGGLMALALTNSLVMPLVGNNWLMPATSTDLNWDSIIHTGSIGSIHMAGTTPRKFMASRRRIMIATGRKR